MNLPDGFKVVEESDHFIMLATLEPVSLRRGDELYKAGYLVNQITVTGLGGLFSTHKAEWKVVCFKLESHGNQKA